MATLMKGRLYGHFASSSLFMASMTHVGVQVSYASSDMQTSDVPVGVLTNIASLFDKLYRGWPSSQPSATKTSNTEALYRTIAHVSLSTTTSEVLMRQITSFLHLPPHWVERFWSWIFGFFFIRWTFFFP